MSDFHYPLDADVLMERTVLAEARVKELEAETDKYRQQMLDAGLFEGCLSCGHQWFGHGDDCDSRDKHGAPCGCVEFIPNDVQVRESARNLQAENRNLSEALKTFPDLPGECAHGEEAWYCVCCRGEWENKVEDWKAKARVALAPKDHFRNTSSTAPVSAYRSCFLDDGHIECVKPQLQARVAELEAERDAQARRDFNRINLLASEKDNLLAENRRLRDAIEKYFGCAVHEDSSDPERNYCQCGWKKDNPIHTHPTTIEEQPA